MEQSIFRYIWNYSRPEQVVVVLLVLLSMIPYYLAFDLPKQIVNGPLQGQGFETPGSTQPFMALSFDVPLIGKIHISDGIDLERLPLLVALSFTFLALVVVNGLFKYIINTRKGLLGERLLRRGRYVLIDRILRFRPARAAQMKAGEVASMVKDEIEPLGGFSADAFTQPVLLGGQAITALVFIFVQHFWLGAVAGILAVVQVAIIPRMRRRLIVLGRERQLTARELAGQVAEIVDGIQTIHANDATNLVRARVSARLGRIFKIRYDIYQWKFLVKFINNFIAQITPFFFYLIGGYLTIIGSLDVGQLIAVINAYKELPGPMKELIDWDLARQDVQVKYEQIVEQFDADDMIASELQRMDAELPEGGFDPLAVQRLTVLGSNGAPLLDDVSFAVHESDFVALVGASADGAPVLGDVLGGQIAPNTGAILLGKHDVSQLPGRVTGRVIGYTGQTPFLEAESVLDNVTYGLKRRPAPLPEDEPAETKAHRLWSHRESERTGNPVLDVDADWIDYDEVQPVPGRENLIGSISAVLDVVGLGEDVISFALRSRLDVSRMPELAEEVLALRRTLSDRLADQELADIVHPFRPDEYNTAATIIENLLFGAPSNPETSANEIFAHPFFEATVRDTGLGAMLFDLGWHFATDTVELYESSQGNPEMLQWLTHVRPEDLPAYQQTLARTRPDQVAAASREDVVRLILLAFQYVEPVYRFGLLDAGRRERLIEGRKALAERLPTDLRGRLQRYDPDTYLNNATLADNILFGKLNHRFVRAEEKIDEIMRSTLRELFARDPAARDAIMSLGLSFTVGPNGRRLTLLQRQKIALARSLVRRSHYYVFNEPLAGSDTGLQGRIITNILGFLSQQPHRPGVVWVLANPLLAERFDKQVELQKGRIVQETAVATKAVAAAV